MNDWGWVPWVLSGVLGITTVYLTLRGQSQTRTAHWLATASKEVESLRGEMKSEIGSVRNDVLSSRNEVTALLAAAKSETLLAVSNSKSDVLQVIAGVDGRVQRVESGVDHVKEQVKDLKTDLGWAVDQIKESVASASSMGRSQGPNIVTPRAAAEDQTEREKT